MLCTVTSPATACHNMTSTQIASKRMCTVHNKAVAMSYVGVRLDWLVYRGLLVDLSKRVGPVCAWIVLGRQIAPPEPVDPDRGSQEDG